jgi:hypothetical protein
MLTCSLSTLTIDFSSAAAYLVKRKTSFMIMMAEVRQSPAMCDVTEWRKKTMANAREPVNRPVRSYSEKIERMRDSVWKLDYVISLAFFFLSLSLSLVLFLSLSFSVSRSLSLLSLFLYLSPFSLSLFSLSLSLFLSLSLPCRRSREKFGSLIIVNIKIRGFCVFRRIVHTLSKGFSLSHSLSRFLSLSVLSLSFSLSLHSSISLFLYLSLLKCPVNQRFL